MTALYKNYEITTNYNYQLYIFEIVIVRDLNWNMSNSLTFKMMLLK